MKKYAFISLIVLQSCAQFQMPMPDMEDFRRNAEVDIFKPNRDFPVMAGDQDMVWDRPTPKVQRTENYRSPASRSLSRYSMDETLNENESEFNEPRKVPNYFRAPSAAKVGMGMTKEEVMDQLGRPSKVEVAGNPENENERWGYLANGAMKYIYFESGYVEGWE